MTNQKFFIFGYYGWKNVGDDSMLYSLIKEIIDNNPSIRISILFSSSSNSPVLPPNSKGKVKLIKPAFLKVAYEILNSSAVLIGGGTHLTEHGDKILSLKRLIRLFLLSIYAKLLGKRIYFLGNGIGPFSTLLGETIAKFTCFLADFITVRDKKSYDYLKKWGYTRTLLSFDFAVLLKEMTDNIKHLKNKKIIGLSVTPFFSIYHNNFEKDIMLVDKIANILEYCLENEKQTEIHLFIFHGGSRNSDIWITKLLQKRLKKNIQIKTRVKIIDYNPDPIKILAHVGECDIFIGTKYHSLVFAYINNLPMLVINYHPKCQNFAEEVGLPEFAVIQPEEILNGKFGEYFNRFQENPEMFVAKLPINQAIKRAKKGIYTIIEGED